MFSNPHKVTLLAISLALLGGCRPSPTDSSSSQAVTTNPKDQQPKATVRQAPSIRYLEDESKLFAKRLGVDAFVYEFSGTCIECWLEYETTDGQSVRSDPIKLTAMMVAQIDAYQDREKTRSIVVWGDPKKELTVHLSMVGISPDGTEYSRFGLTENYQIPQMPREKMGTRPFVTTTEAHPERLPEEVDKEFVILSYGWKEELITNGESVIRELTVRLKGKRLPGRNEKETGVSSE